MGVFDEVARRGRAAWSWARPRGKVQETSPRDPPGIIPAWLIWQTKAAAWVAVASLVYFLWLFSLDAARDSAEALHVTHAGLWRGNIEFWFPIIVGFTLIAIGIPWLAKILIPAFVSLSFKRPGEGWPKFWLLVLVVMTSSVIIAGTVSVQTDTRLERNRGGAIEEQRAARGRAGLQADLDTTERELNRLCAPEDDTPGYQQQACRAGATAWGERLAEARAQNDYQAAAIARALSDARQGDRFRAEQARLRRAIAEAPVAAEVQERVVRREDEGVVALVDFVTAWRAVLLAVVMDIAALLLSWIALRLEQARNRQLSEASAGVLDEGHMIADLRAEPGVVAEPMEAARTFDAETGDELVRVKGAAPHFRRKRPRRGEDRTESGVQMDADPRVARVEVEAAASEAAPDNGAELTDQPLAPPDASSEAAMDALDEETIAALAALQAQPDEPPPEDDAPALSAPTPLPDNEGTVRELTEEERTESAAVQYAAQ